MYQSKKISEWPLILFRLNQLRFRPEAAVNILARFSASVQLPPPLWKVGDEKPPLAMSVGQHTHVIPLPVTEDDFRQYVFDWTEGDVTCRLISFLAEFGDNATKFLVVSLWHLGREPVTVTEEEWNSRVAELGLTGDWFMTVGAAATLTETVAFNGVQFARVFSRWKLKGSIAV